MNKVKSTTMRVLIVLTFSVNVVMAITLAQGKQIQRRADFCSQTARALFQACKAEANDGFFKKKAICLNISDPDRREVCFDEADAALEEANQTCTEQRDGRVEACNSLGQDRYDPEIDPAKFDTDFNNLTRPNTYFPLRPGNRWEYQGGNEVNTVEVTSRTKLIEGVTCIVVDDLVFKDGDLSEDTADYFAMNKDGNVHYFGEEVKDYQTFSGDRPRRPGLVSIDGSFKHGREGDKGGIIFLASPTRGKAYLEEFSLGNAEDVTEILSTNYAFGSDRELDRFVPQQLVERLCSQRDCIVTRNFSLLEPGISARKYYARGIGFFLEVKPDSGQILQLVTCNFDSKCASLPRP